MVVAALAITVPFASRARLPREHVEHELTYVCSACSATKLNLVCSDEREDLLRFKLETAGGYAFRSTVSGRACEKIAQPSLAVKACSTKPMHSIGSIQKPISVISSPISAITKLIGLLNFWHGYRPQTAGDVALTPKVA